MRDTNANIDDGRQIAVPLDIWIHLFEVLDDKWTQMIFFVFEMKENIIQKHLMLIIDLSLLFHLFPSDSDVQKATVDLPVVICQNCLLTVL